MPKNYRIKSDGKDMTFTPGKYGSLVSDPKTPSPLDFTRKKVSKTIPANIRKNRDALSRTLTGSSRG